MNKLILLSIILSLTGCASVTPQQESARNALQEKHFYKYDLMRIFFRRLRKIIWRRSNYIWHPGTAILIAQIQIVKT